MLQERREKEIFLCDPGRCLLRPHVYQMSTKKSRKALKFKELKNYHFLHVYQMSTRVTFLLEKRLFFYFPAAFCDIFCHVRSVILG